MPPVSESVLIRQLKLKDQKYFNYLYDNYSPSLYASISSRVKCKLSAEEILQNVFVKIWLHIDTYIAEKGTLYTWILIIARNETLDYIRSKEAKNKKITSIVCNIDIHEVFNDPAALRYDWLKALLTLAYNERVIIELYSLGFTCKEIGKILCMPEGSVKTRMRYAYKKLKLMLA